MNLPPSFRALIACCLLAACSASSEPQIPPLGTKVPPTPAEGLEHPARTRIRTVSTSCSMPRPSEDAKIVGIMVSRGNGLSNIAVAGQDKLTTVSTINIEPGDTPIYLFALSGTPMLWIFEGATERVERFIVQPSTNRQGPGVAVLGLSARKVGALGADACGKPYDLLQNGAEDLFQKLSRHFARDDLALIGFHSIGAINVPSGKLGRGRSAVNGPTISTAGGTYVIEGNKPVRVNTHSRTYAANQLKRFYPAGLVMIHPEDVAATRPVDVYDVLPAEAGLIQLMEAGVLTFDKTTGGYLINGPLPRIPPGARSTKFGLREGVAPPKAGLGNSHSLYDATTGECLDGLCKWLEETSRMDEEYRKQAARRSAKRSTRHPFRRP